jgi:hypothetical protein
VVPCWCAGREDWFYAVHESRRPKVRCDQNNNTFTGDNKRIVGNGKSLNLNHCECCCCSSHQLVLQLLAGCEVFHCMQQHLAVAVRACCCRISVVAHSSSQTLQQVTQLACANMVIVIVIPP